MRAAVVALALVLAFASATPGAGQPAFPASARIRGENVWLRAEPAEATEVLAYLQRGEPITLTGPAEPADGDRYYSVAVDRTGEAGWVRELFVTPDSIASLGAAPVVVDAPAPAVAEPEPRADAEARRQERAAARGAARDAARQAERATQPEAREPGADVPPPVEGPDEAPGAGCDPSYPDVCLPPPPPDLDCADIAERDFRVQSPDPHGFDGNDNDGRGCES